MLVAVVVILAAASTVAAAKDHPRCRHYPRPIQRPCFVTVGSYGLSADAWLTIGRHPNASLIVGRLAGVPKNLDDAWERAYTRTQAIMVRVRGRFEVCPVPTEDDNKFGLQYVCIESASRLTVDMESVPAEKGQ